MFRVSTRFIDVLHTPLGISRNCHHVTMVRCYDCLIKYVIVIISKLRYANAEFAKNYLCTNVSCSEVISSAAATAASRAMVSTRAFCAYFTYT